MIGKGMKKKKKKLLKNLVSWQKGCNFASQSGRTRESSSKQNAKIAQLVEHDLAKVGVAGSSPVFRSECPDGGIGRRATLRG